MKLQATNEEMKLSDGIQSYVCTYDKVPGSKIPMVVESKESLLQEIHLEDMLQNLDNSAELLYIAFCALHGKSVQGDLDGLQAALLSLCAKSKVTMTTFRDQSKSITIQVLGSYKWMRKGMVSQAKMVFDSTAKYAAQMAKQSHDLSVEFENLANQTTEVLKKVEVEHAGEIKNRDELVNELKSMQAENAKQVSLAKSLTEDITKINVEYQEEKEALSSAEKREFGLGIASMLVGALSLGLGSLANSKKGTEPSINQEEVNRLNQQKKENADKQVQLNKEKEREEIELKKRKEELVDLENKKRTLKEQCKNEETLFSKETDEELKKAQQLSIQKLTSEISNIEKEIVSKKDKISLSEKSLKDYTAELTGLSDALKSITNSLTNMQQKAQDAVESHAKKVNSLLEKKLQMEKDKRESLAELEKFAILIQQNSNKKITTDTAIQMLLVAIKCLKKVASSLIVAAMFWESLEQYCGRLSESVVGQLLDSVKDLPKEERIEFFEDEDFALSILTYAAQWAAMYYVSDEYYLAANKTYEHANNNFISMPSESEALLIAQQRSTGILANISSQKRDAQLNVQKIENQLKK